MIEAGTLIAGRYEVEELIGRGGMGEVYAARHAEIGKRVAIKFLGKEYKDDAETLTRFHQEARIAGNLGHENICAVLDFGTTDEGIPFIVMEYLEGESLAELIKREGRLEVTRALGIMHQVLAAIEEAHASDILHRDLKPENVFLARTKRGEAIKLLDFGISKMLGPEERLDLTRTGAMVGTPFYMSPEHVRGLKDVDHRTDIYSCGVMLYEMLTGDRPYDGNSFNEIMFKIVEEPFPMPEEDHDIPLPVLQLVMKAMAKKPEGRPASATEMKDEVAELIGRSVSETMPVARPRGELKKSAWQRISMYVLVPLIVILLVAGVSLFALRSMTRDDHVARVNLFPVPQDGKWGFIDAKGQMAIAPLFDNVGDFSDGLVRVLVGRKWGFVDAAGMTVIQPAYEKVSDFSEGFAAVLVDEKWGYVDRRGNLALAAIYDEAGDFSEGLAPVRVGEKWGFVDTRGRMVIEPKFLAASGFHDERAAVSTDRGWGHIRPDGALAGDPVHWYAGDFSGGLARVKSCKGDVTEFCTWGFVDPRGRVVIEPELDWAYDFSEGLALVLSAGKWGFIGPQGHFEIQPRFANASSFHGGLARVLLGGRWGYVDRTGKWIMEPSFYLAGDFEGPLAGVTYVTKLPGGGNPIETASGYIDQTGAVVWNPPAEDLSSKVPEANQRMWNFDFLTGKIRVIGSFDPSTYELKFREEAGTFTTVPLELPHPLELGGIRTVFPAENYTLIITDNVMAQTLGWAAMIAGETSLLKSRVEGREMITNVSVIPLTADIRGDNLLSWALGANRLYMLSRQGKVKHKLIDDVYAGLHEHIMPGPPSPQARLHYRDGLVFLFEPGETFRVMKDGTSTSIELVERELGFTLPEGFDIEDVPGEISFKTGGDPVSLVIAEVAASLEPPPLEE